MQIGLHGFGRMAREVKTYAESTGNNVVYTYSLHHGNIEELFKASSILIDFSHEKAIKKLLEINAQYMLPIIVGTTGIDDSTLCAIKDHGKIAPIFYTTNFSLGLQVAKLAIELICSKLPNADVNILDIHHSQKIDAPSGTSLAIGKTLSSNRLSGPSYSSIRIGDVIGEHTVTFAINNEQIKVTHTAFTRSVFAKTVIDIAIWLHTRKLGFYEMGDYIHEAKDGI